MRRFVMLLCVLFLAVFIGAGIINSDSDPPCAELTEIILNQIPAELSQNFPNPFNVIGEESQITGTETGIVFENTVRYDLTVLSLNDNMDYSAQFSIQNSESAIYDVYFLTASQADVIDKIMDAGQNPKVIVVGSVDSFIYNGEFDVTVTGQVAYPLIA